MVSVKPKYCPSCGTALEDRQIEARDRAWCPSCNRGVFRDAVPAVRVCIKNSREVLLIRRGMPPNPGSWALPGGHPEYDEPPELAATREIADETGLDVAASDLDLMDLTYGQPENTELHYYLITYEIDQDLTSGELRAGGDAEDVAYWTLDEILDDSTPVRKTDREWIRSRFGT